MNNKVKFLRGTSGEYAVAEKDSDTIYFTTDDGKLYIGDKEISGSDITIDDTLSDTSTNPVQNKVVKQAIDNKADKTVVTISADGLMSAEDKSKLDSVDDTYALKSKYGDTTINVGRKAGTDVGDRSTAEGDNTTASGTYSHAEGCGTTASGDSSHAEGYYTTASGAFSHAGGSNTKALHDNEVAYGKYNESNDDTLFSIGDGTSDSDRHNAFEITTSGGMLHDKDILTSAHCIQFIPHNMKYYAQNDRILLFSNGDDLTRGIYFVNNTPNEIIVCALISASAEGPAVQYGYGSNTYPEIQNTGDGREWFTEEPIPTSPTIFVMAVPSGKLGYYGVYHNSEMAYTTFHDIRCPYFNYF